MLHVAFSSSGLQSEIVAVCVKLPDTGAENYGESVVIQAPHVLQNFASGGEYFPQLGQ